jgi:hypothetical protein
MVDKKPVWDCKFRDYFTPTEVKQKEPKPLKPPEDNYGNKLNFKEQKQ